MTNRLLIIPARAGSKRIKKKYKKIRQKTYYLLLDKTALKCRIFDEIHVSTESNEIKKIVEKYPLKVKFLREKRLSSDHTPLMDVLKIIIINI